MYLSPGSTNYLTLDDVVTFLDHGPTPVSRSATGYGERALSVRLRCAVGDDPRAVIRRVYVLNYGNGGATPYVYGRVSGGERVRFYLDPHVLAWIQSLRDTAGPVPVSLADVRSAALRDARLVDAGQGYGYAQRLGEGGAPRRPLRIANCRSTGTARTRTVSGGGHAAT
ncbi:hypothetical protein AU099_gp77 [Gordonia phage GTE8]|uniref:Uncharacterized protein n=1 Tax=Gordonia phage GTE8 TaxID=1647475 RepID=A0A0K0N6H7_9CAUD|nr:hypothetical protein AU099_gp77 [Gordonia phage GTE8]AKJ72420.1 hypothetical protein GTE8_77 [Gordonia phage GTE8]